VVCHYFVNGKQKFSEDTKDQPSKRLLLLNEEI